MASKVIITGATGGMGRACAWLFGSAHELVLTDVGREPLEQFAEELRDDGFRVLAFAGDIASEPVLSRIAQVADGTCPITLIHTAGIGPSQADWRTIISINLIAAARVVRAVEPSLAAGSVAVLIASMAGYMMPPVPQLAALVADPLAPGLLDALAPIVAEMAPEDGVEGNQGLAYILSKYGIHRLAENCAGPWGRKGARIASISPGFIMTPMGRRELISSPTSAAHADTSPLGRRGTAMDIALAAQFLASDAAAYVTGCDLRVDGGSTAVSRTDG